MRTLRPLLLFVCSLSAFMAAARPQLVPITDASVIAGQSSNPGDMRRAGSLVFFEANDGVHGSELWRTDGTAAGTRLVKDLRPGPDPSGPTIAGALGDAVVFAASSDGVNREIWRSDGTDAGTWRLGIIPASNNESGYDYYVRVITAGTRVFLIVRQTYEGPHELWASGSTANSLRRVGSYPILLTPEPFGRNGRLYFVAADDYVGPQFWTSDGTSLGTHMVRRGMECPATPCSTAIPRSFFSAGDQVLFTDVTGLWKTDGTAAGSVRIATIEDPSPVAIGSTVTYLWAAGHLWRTDGTAAGTRDAGPVAGVSPNYAAVLDDGRLIYPHTTDSYNYDYWRSDGTAAGTVKIATARVPSPGAYAPILAVLGTRLLIPGGTSSTGSELAALDADTGTVMFLEDLDPRIKPSGVQSGLPGVGATLGTKAVFAATDVSGRELWISDGTPDGTQLLANIAAEAAGGAVTGTVRDALTSNVVSNATVMLCPQPTGCDESTRTGPDGVFHFTGVIPATYYLTSYSGLHLAQLYDGKSCPCPGSHGTPVTVTAGYQTNGIDFSLSRAGSISGTIRRLKDGTPVQTDVAVRWNGTIYRLGRSNQNGEYRVSGLSPGSYTVETSSLNYPVPTGPVIDQVHGGANCPSSGCEGIAGTAVAVTAGQDTPNIDFSLRSFGTISGTIRDASTGLATRHGGPIAIVPTASPAHYAGSFYPNFDGTYQSEPLRPGTYYVSTSGGNGYSGVAHPDKACPTYPCDFTGATAVTVAMDGAVQNVDLLLPQTLSRVSGVVRDASGIALGGIYVRLFAQDGSYAWSDGTGRTDENGRYSLYNVAAGTYYVKARDQIHPSVICTGSPCNFAGATAVVLTAGQTATVDFNLLARLSTFRGRVLDSTGNTVAAAQLAVQVPAGSTFESRAVSGPVPEGTYVVGVLTRATTLYLSASADGYHRITHPNVRSDCAVNPCPVPAGATAFAPGNHTSIDLTLPRFGAISGRVLDDRTGLPLAGVAVQFKPATGTSGYARTGDDGRYRWQYADGTYRVYVDTTHTYRGQVYLDLDCAESCVPESGAAVTVADGGETTGIDFRLKALVASGTIRGRVVDDATGAPLAGANVTAYRSGSYEKTAIADAEGYYTLDALASGAYRLYTQASGPYFLAVYGAGHCADFYDCDRTGGSDVTVTAPNDTTGVDFRMIRLRLTSIAPAQGSTAGGTRIVVNGANFTPTATLLIGGREASIVSQSATQIVALTPSGAPGPAHVTVRIAPNLTVTLGHAFTYNTTDFSDEPLVAGKTLRAVHILELRNAINALRATANLGAFTFTDATLVGKPARSLHILQLRTALDQARTALGKPALAYTNALTVGTPVRAVDVAELRAGVK